VNRTTAATTMVGFATLILVLTSVATATAQQQTSVKVFRNKDTVAVIVSPTITKNATILTNQNDSILFAPIQNGTTSIAATAKNGTTSVITTNSTTMTQTETGTIIIEPPPRR
jgi:predicted transcriptional regulator